MDELVVDKTTYNGLYYFDEYGKMVTDPGIHYLEMNAAGQMFDGYYYFGGENGVLLQEEGETPEGFSVDKSGKVETKDLGMDGLEKRLADLLGTYEGTWSVYVKDLTSDQEFEQNSQSLYSASLIKVFVMAQTYANMDTVLQSEAAKMKKDVTDPSLKKPDAVCRRTSSLKDSLSLTVIIFQRRSLTFVDTDGSVTSFFIFAASL